MVKAITRALSSVFGGGQSAPTVQTVAPAAVEEDERKAKKIRSALYSTSGGASGEEVAAVSQSGRSTLYGN